MESTVPNICLLKRLNRWKAPGSLYLSNFRMIFVAKKEDESGRVYAYLDLPAAWRPGPLIAWTVSGSIHFFLCDHSTVMSPLQLTPPPPPPPPSLFFLS